MGQNSSKTSISPADKIKQIIKIHYNQQKQHLNLCGCIDWIPAIQSRNWIFLQTIELSHCEVNDLNIRYFMVYQWNKLKILEMYWNKIGPNGIRCFTEKQWPLIQMLSLGKNNIGNIGVKLLTKIDLPRLKILNLRQCKITDEGMTHLIKGKWSRLEQLIISKYLHVKGENDANMLYNQILWENMWKKFQILSIYRINQICLLNLVLLKKDGNRMPSIFSSPKNQHFMSQVDILMRKLQ